MKEIILYGAGGHCYAAIDLINSLNEYTPKVVFDDAPVEKEILNVEVKKYEGHNLKDHSLCITIGNNAARKKVAEKIEAEFPIFIHKSAVVYSSVKIGRGTLVHPNAVVDADVEVGDFCIVNNNATVSHNVRIDDFVHVAIQAAIAGGVTVGEGSLLGAGCVVNPEVKIGKWATIGAGAVVTKNVPDYAVVFGNPARIIKYTDEF